MLHPDHPLSGNKARLGRSRTRRAGLAALGVIVALAGGCKKGDERNAYVAPPPPEVLVARPMVRDVVTYRVFTGVIAASESVDLRARVEGFLEKINFEPGQRVKKGDLLFQLDKREYQAAVERAEATVRARAAALLGAENDARLARELADQKAGAEIDAIMKTAKRDSIKADLAGAEAELAQAKLNLEYCDVAAPIDGRIGRNFVDIGNLVGHIEPTLLAQIVQASPAFVSIEANESDVLAVRRDAARRGEHELGQTSAGQWHPCALSLADEAEFKFQGRVDYVDPKLSQDTNTLVVRTRYDNADEALLPGLFARVRFAIPTEKAMMVPEAALLSDQQGRFCLTVNAKDVVEPRRVRIGTLDGTLRVVEEGLSPEDRVVVLGVLKARPGTQVTPKMHELAATGP